jgi:hypothetical protein
MPNAQEIKNIKIGAYIPYLNATELGMIVGGLEFMDESKAEGVKADVTGDADVAFYNKPGNCKAKFKIVSHTPERTRALFDALILQNGNIVNDSRAGKQLKDYVFTFVHNAVLSDGQTSSSESYQIYKGTVVNGYKVKSESSKAIEIEVEVQGAPDLSKLPNMPSYIKGPNLTLPTPRILYIDTINAGNYSVKPTGITVAGITGAAFDSMANADGSLTIFCTNFGTAGVTDIETWKTLTITGGTSTVTASARVRIG